MLMEASCGCKECRDHQDREECGLPATVEVWAVPMCRDCARRDALRRFAANCACDGDGCDHDGHCGRSTAREGRLCPDCSSTLSQRVDIPPGQQQCSRCTILCSVEVDYCSECCLELGRAGDSPELEVLEVG